MLHTPSVLVSATYGALLLAVIALWLGPRIWIPLLCVATVLGYLAGVLNGPAFIWIVVFAGLCAAYPRATTRARKGLAAAGIVLLALPLGMHVLPGFWNFLLLEDIVLSPGAAPYTMYLNFDKTLVGIGILGLCGHALLKSAEAWGLALRRAAPILVANIVVVALIAMALGYLTWQPKWTPLFWVWAASNLFFTCLSEEAFFRGFIQRELAAVLQGRSYADGIAIAASAILFGVAHFAGGATYVALGIIAGLGYALVYHRTKSIEMSMLAHFAVNATHFLLFTYPRAIS
jgi:membrane protease YdiL (CAAX protease family)